MKPILELESIEASYGMYKALFGVSIVLHDKEIVALIGPNGAGKSTVARCISGLVRIKSGSIKYCGSEISKLRTHQISRLGIVHYPEGKAVFSSLTVEDNLKISFLNQTKRRKQLDSVLDRSVEEFPWLKPKLKNYAGNLSGGEKRLLSLIPAIITPPPVIVADELCLGLSPKASSQLIGYLKRIKDAGTAMILIEQVRSRIQSLTPRYVKLERGRILTQE